MSPALPPEIEHEIFTFAFQNELSNPINLMLTARRVHDWLIPKIYHVVVFRSTRTYPQNASASTLKVYGHHTRHLIIGSITSPISEVLSCCPNLENLALWTGASSWSDDLGLESQNALTTLRLSRLSIRLGRLEGFDLLETTDYPGDNTGAQEQAQIATNIKRFLSTITHLDVCTKVGRLSEISTLRYCTSLTHICLFASLPPQLLRWVFDVCNKLEVLICLITRSTGENEDALVAVKSDEALQAKINGESEGLSQDEIEKIVFVRCNGYGEDWENGARGEEDMWALAEREVKRVRGSKNGVSGPLSMFGGL
ncbi:hypothetical protein BDN72DRAFT_961219 [Pluteus cervinus]|uniref:Uncharacterized protein n=1 Tax=Pluteus cervinus TaxID=181527 RepID=A0ACD3ANI5_9AGAR|nr:hypothetical protein BDN72DRAFT_961219 [Pluteus cervinus]